MSKVKFTDFQYMLVSLRSNSADLHTNAKNCYGNLDFEGRLGRLLSRSRSLFVLSFWALSLSLAFSHSSSLSSHEQSPPLHEHEQLQIHACRSKRSLVIQGGWKPKLHMQAPRFPSPQWSLYFYVSWTLWKSGFNGEERQKGAENTTGSMVPGSCQSGSHAISNFLVRLQKLSNYESTSTKKPTWTTGENWRGWGPWPILLLPDFQRCLQFSLQNPSHYLCSC